MGFARAPGRQDKKRADRKMDIKTNLLDLDRAELEAFFLDIGESAFRASQVMKWIYQAGVVTFADMNNLSKSLRLRLQQIADVCLPEIVACEKSTDGVIKWLIRVEANNCIETVFIPEGDRGTLCVSSQLGCALKCPFCSTAQQGFNRNLRVGEIIGQVWLARQALLEPGFGITNIVLMGMGEPLLNFTNVMHAINLMMDDFAYGLSKRRVTLSTSGVVPMLDRLSTECEVSLAISLHAANDELRNKLVPLNKKYPIKSLLASCRRYLQHGVRRSITIEYVMLADVNDSPEAAAALVKCLRDLSVKVNLIPFNPFPGCDYRCSSQSAIDCFRSILMRAGIFTISRKTRGEDISAACGQLVGQVQKRRGISGQGSIMHNQKRMSA